jgi:hypothetical protein
MCELYTLQKKRLKHLGMDLITDTDEDDGARIVDDDEWDEVSVT